MYATIRRFEGVAGFGDEMLIDGQRLATAVSREPGFVVYALLDAGDGVLISVSIFEDQSGLAGADHLVEGWGATHVTGEPSPSPVVSTGEVVIQKGM
jgi:hypothetical protein